jgi:hypothetical protein
MAKIWTLLHLLSAFSFVGSLVVADWNGRAARATADWGQRAVLFRVALTSSRAAGFLPLLLVGIFGNLTSVGLGLSMATDAWLRWANGLWLAAVLVMAAVSLPAAYRLAGVSKAAASGGSSEGYDPALRRWRIGNVLLSVLYLAMLVVMVYGTRS